MELIAYIRVSTSRQELGPEAQRDMIATYAARAGDTVVEWHEEAVSGGAELDERPALMDAIDALDDGMGLIVAKRDRLAREVLNAGLIERLVERKGARVFTVDGAGNDDSPESRLMRQMIDAFAEYERQIIRARTKQALAAKKRRSERVGSIPYGQELAHDGKTLVDSDQDKKLIARAKRLQRGGMSVRAIAAKLASEGYVTRRGTPMTKSTVGNLLRR